MITPLFTPNETAIHDYQAKLHGTVLQPEDDNYDAACRIWNGMIDRRPAVIAQCALCDGGLVIDLSRMRAVRVDPEARRVHAQGGVTIGELDRATQAYGLATPMGVVTETGIA